MYRSKSMIFNCGSLPTHIDLWKSDNTWNWIIFTDNRDNVIVTLNFIISLSFSQIQCGVFSLSKANTKLVCDSVFNFQQWKNKFCYCQMKHLMRHTFSRVFFFFSYNLCEKLENISEFSLRIHNRFATYFTLFSIFV